MRERRKKKKGLKVELRMSIVVSSKRLVGKTSSPEVAHMVNGSYAPRWNSYRWVSQVMPQRRSR